jgi:hypothetical protein
MSEEYCKIIAIQDGKLLRIARTIYKGKESDIGNYIEKRMPKGVHDRTYLVMSFHNILCDCLEKIKANKSIVD